MERHRITQFKKRLETVPSSAIYSGANLLTPQQQISAYANTTQTILIVEVTEDLLPEQKAEIKKTDLNLTPEEEGLPIYIEIHGQRLEANQHCRLI